MKPIRWGVLGYAHIAVSQFIPALLEVKNAVPYAIASRDKEKLREAMDRFPFVKAYESYDLLLEDPDVDAVYIPLPNSLHKEWTIKAARSGKHVLCEKPLALTRADCLEMIQACEASGVKLMEAFMYRLSSRTQILNELLAAGAVGEIRAIHSSHRFLLEDPNSIKFKPGLGGGSFWDVGCYPINFIDMIMQREPLSFSAHKVTRHGVDISFSAILQYSGGVLCTASSGFDSLSAQVSVINGTRGCLTLRDTFQEKTSPILLYQDGKTTEIPVPACKRYVLEAEEFSAAILENREPAISLQEAVRNNSLIEKLYQAAMEFEG